ncbi:MAG: hypothetical protein ABH812_04040 [bacterium]
MDPQNNQENSAQDAQIKPKNRMVWIWIALVGGFFIIILLIALLIYQPKSKSDNIMEKNNTESQVETTITPSIENIDKEVEDIDLGSLDSDLQDVQKDIDQL